MTLSFFFFVFVFFEIPLLVALGIFFSKFEISSLELLVNVNPAHSECDDKHAGCVWWRRAAAGRAQPVTQAAPQTLTDVGHCAQLCAASCCAWPSQYSSRAACSPSIRRPLLLSSDGAPQGVASQHARTHTPTQSPPERAAYGLLAGPHVMKTPAGNSAHKKRTCLI